MLIWQLKQESEFYCWKSYLGTMLRLVQCFLSSSRPTLLFHNATSVRRLHRIFMIKLSSRRLFHLLLMPSFIPACDRFKLLQTKPINFDYITASHHLSVFNWIARHVGYAIMMIHFIKFHFRRIGQINWSNFKGIPILVFNEIFSYVNWRLKSIPSSIWNDRFHLSFIFQ